MGNTVSHFKTFKLLKWIYLLFLRILIWRVIFGFDFWTWSYIVVQAAFHHVTLLPRLPWIHIQHGRMSINILYLQTYCKNVNKKYDLSNLKSYFIFNYVSRYVYVCEYGCQWRPEEAIGIPGTRINKLFWVSQYGCWELNSGPLSKECKFLTDEPPLQFPQTVFNTSCMTYDHTSKNIMVLNCYHHGGKCVSVKHET